ncbi:UPF0223 family protein [Shouchella lonarensis]|uniref:Uncharacterized protein YktA, UPF0223 family n=1 Tax=Shouchella lonarensis TaxID=1464122 RepID=A0A1G6KR29_9BACI|nr:UPF0223 family protein [Shouchella lonarensis]SDC33562.1 Uncharacterized protein YktA, UPF0223 family [Shouchella lonarensis]
MNIPLNDEWTQNEVVIVAEFCDCIARVFEQGVEAREILRRYEQFKEVVPAKSEEKQLFKDIDKEIGTSCYHVVQAAKQAKPQERIKL